MTPDQEGTASLDWEITYEDNGPTPRRISGVEYLEVSAQGVASGAHAMTIYEAPVDQSQTVVQGDSLAPGAVKQGEGVVLQKGAQAPSTPNFCPHCGKSLREEH